MKTKWKQIMGNHTARSASITERPLWLLKWMHYWRKHSRFFIDKDQWCRTVRKVMLWKIFLPCGWTCDVCITLMCRPERQLTQPTANFNLGLEEAVSLRTACPGTIQRPLSRRKPYQCQTLSEWLLSSGVDMFVSWAFITEPRAQLKNSCQYNPKIANKGYPT